MRYSFEPPAVRKQYTYYREEDLRGMTLMQLRDVMESEGIVDPALDRLDNDELINRILLFRGSREPFLISGYAKSKMDQLQRELKKTKLQALPHDRINVPSKISVYDGMDTGFFDDYRVSWQKNLDGVNAFVVDQEMTICAVMRVMSVPGRDDLYLFRLAEFPCHEAQVRDYRLMLCPLNTSDEMTYTYTGEATGLPLEISAYLIPLLGFEVCIPRETSMPLAIDFGTTNTAAGMYVSKSFFSQIETHMQPGLIQPDSINYLRFLTQKGEIVPILPTTIGVERIESGHIRYSYGFDAEGMSARGYLGSGLCVFNDIKRWVAAYDETETLTDSSGRQAVMPRKQIIQAFLEHIIRSAEHQFKCRFKKLFLSYPVKQRERFIALYREILDGYELLEDDMFDEGIAVLYSVIGTLIDEKKFRDNTTHNALILDCGGGTTDQSSASFKIRKGKVAFDIDIETAYENGDTDFGGNNLTFRIMQLLKIEAARLIGGKGAILSELVFKFSFDLYRAVDDHGRDAVYQELEQAYADAETVIPTRFKEYEYGAGGRDEYYRVYNNFHYLFHLAEQVKKAFFDNDQILRIVVASEPQREQTDTVFLPAQKWKLSTKLPGAAGSLTVQKQFPIVSINTHQVRAVFKADIYDIIRRFVGRLYEEKTLSRYKIVKLTGQSCKIELFRDALKEFVPGVLIRQGQSLQANHYQLKLTCLEGSIRYLRDKTLGYARVNISSGQPALPYVLTAFTHDGEPVTLIHSLDRDRVSGMVSRHIAATEVDLTLSDTRGNQKYVYTITCSPKEFTHVTYDKIEETHGIHIPQAEVDDIENDSVRYFVWADTGQWGFSIVPVSRKNEELYMGSQQLHSFENESWMVNYFDGKH